MWGNPALMSLVVAGCYEVDPVVQHLAGPYGKIRAGTPEEQQLMFDLTSCRKAEAAFIELSGALYVEIASHVRRELTRSHPRAGVLGPGALANLFEFKFLTEADRYLRSGHSVSSAVADILSKASWILPHEAANTAGAALEVSSPRKKALGSSSASVSSETSSPQCRAIFACPSTVARRYS